MPARRFLLKASGYARATDPTLFQNPIRASGRSCGVGEAFAEAGRLHWFGAASEPRRAARQIRPDSEGATRKTRCFSGQRKEKSRRASLEKEKKPGQRTVRAKLACVSVFRFPGRAKPPGRGKGDAVLLLTSSAARCGCRCRPAGRRCGRRSRCQPGRCRRGGCRRARRP